MRSSEVRNDCVNAGSHTSEELIHPSTGRILVFPRRAR